MITSPTLLSLAGRREARLDARQSRCQHRWVHASEAVHNRLVMSTWCDKCKITAFAFAGTPFDIVKGSGRALTEDIKSRLEEFL